MLSFIDADQCLDHQWHYQSNNILCTPHSYSMYIAHIFIASASVLCVYIHCQKSYIARTTRGAIRTVSVSFHCEVYMYMLHITYKLKLNNRGAVFHDAIYHLDYPPWNTSTGGTHNYYCWINNEFWYQSKQRKAGVVPELEIPTQ